ncbi:MAG TPA: low specificity L-threonine aldolase [Steroidobacteraceae bacterium]|nr:low specificity L-threonine aldolase [Steroidobacteraceae bacterium]
MSRNFKSDNVTPACDVIMAAIQDANVGSVPSYGGDELTQRLQNVASDVFGREVAIFPVTTGTAANALALSEITPPYGAVYCHDAAHIVTDECGAPEFFTGGAKMIGFPTANGKITPEQLVSAIAFAEDMGVHHVKPGAVSVSQATEWGTVYELSELSALGTVARQHALPLHMDGARFANALVHLGCSPAEATWKSGVDVLSLGATKNGALCAEAVVFFDPARVRDFERRRKRAGHLWSKLRFVSAQLLAYFENALWLANARHANAMASALGEGLRSVRGASLLQSVDANEVFVALPEATVAALENQGFEFYRWPLCTTPTGVAIRLVTSYATPRVHVDEFLAAAQGAARG